MATLIGAIVTAINGDTPLQTTAPGGGWTAAAPENTSKPYVIVQNFGGETQFSTGDPYSAEPLIQFTVHGESYDSVRLVMEDLQDLFDKDSDDGHGGALSFDESSNGATFNRVGEPAIDAVEDNPGRYIGIVAYEVGHTRTKS